MVMGVTSIGKSAFLGAAGILEFAVSGGRLAAGTMWGCGGGVTGWGLILGGGRGWERRFWVLGSQDGGKKGRVLDVFWQAGSFENSEGVVG